MWRNKDEAENQVAMKHYLIKRVRTCGYIQHSLMVRLKLR